MVKDIYHSVPPFFGQSLLLKNYLCPVKFLCLLISFYVVLLSAKPCCADRECQEQSSVKKEQARKTSSKEKECQGCSPFFSCGSCVGFIVAKPVTHTLAFVAENEVRSYAPYEQAGFKEISLAIWQPPQLG